MPSATSSKRWRPAPVRRRPGSRRPTSLRRIRPRPCGDPRRPAAPGAPGRRGDRRWPRPGGRDHGGGPTPRLPVCDGLAAAANVGGDDGEPARGRLHRRSGEPFAVRRQREQVEGRIDEFHVLPFTGEDDAAASTGIVDVVLGDGVALVAVGSTDDHEYGVGVPLPQDLGGSKELTKTLSPHETPDRSHHEGLVAYPEIVPQAPSGLLAASGPKPLQVDAIAEQHQLVPRYPDPLQRVQILRVLDEFRAGAHGGGAFEAVDDGPAESAVLGTGVEAMHGVDHAAHTGGPGRHTSVDARLGVVCVDNVGLQPPKELPQFTQGHDVLGDGNRPGGMPKRNMTDSPRLQLRDVGPGCGHADDLHAGRREPTELGAQEESEAHVDRGDVDEPLSGQSTHIDPVSCR